MIQCDNLVKIYKTKDIEVVALQGLDLEVAHGELMAIVGNSGSGKSTLLNIIGGLDRPSAGSISVDGKDLLKYTEKDLIAYRRDTVGFVWQNSARNLIPYLSAVENVEIPMIIAKSEEKRERAEKLLDLVGLSHRRFSRLRELSGGEQQRVAIAIALSNQPKLLLADEPTGSVDSKMTKNILQVLWDINRNIGISVVIVTHDRAVSQAVDRVVAIRDGRTSSEFIRREAYLDAMSSLGDSLEEEETHEEFAVIDKTGRLQIPREHLEALGVVGQNKIKVEFENNRIILAPASEEKD
jgi:ABC-type lipoprotein export system ATPase subunit